MGRYKAEPILEVGAGSGIVLKALRDRGFDAEGVELATYAAPIQGLPLQYGVDAFTLPAEQKARYRSIALFDVIEHLPERVAFLRGFREHFPNIQYLYITVPAFPELFSNYDEFYGHYLRYTVDILQKELLKAGYVVMYQRYFFHALYWIIRATLWVQRQRTTEFHPPKGPSRWLHVVLGKYFYWEGRLLPPLWRGSSLLCIARPA